MAKNEVDYQFVPETFFPFISHPNKRKSANAASPYSNKLWSYSYFYSNKVMLIEATWFESNQWDKHYINFQNNLLPLCLNLLYLIRDIFDIWINWLASLCHVCVHEWSIIKVTDKHRRDPLIANKAILLQDWLPHHLNDAYHI